MARGKKKENLTPEERLQAALVPDWEQPYKVPENWCWTRISNVTQILNGFAFKSKMYTDSGIRIIRISNVQDGYIEDEKPVYYPLTSQDSILAYILENEDLLMSLTGNVGRVAIIDNSMLPAALNQRVACIRMADSCCNKCFLFYYFLRKEFVQDCIKNSKGSAQLNMSTEWLKQYPLPLPPLPEQQRIVDRIESLFAKLDEAKQKAQDALDSFETRKAAILHKAFTGELTARWRKEHGVGMESWERKRIEEICITKAGYAFDSKKFTNSGYQVVRMGNLYGGKLDLFRNPVFISENDIDSSILDRAEIKNGDILITLTGTKYKRDYGYAVCILNPTKKLLVNQRILCLTPLDTIKRNYILYYLQSNIFRDIFFSNETGGVNQGNVSSKFVEKIEVQIPIIDEQAQIVRILDDLLAKEQQAKEAAEAVLEQIDLMKKSILARAFRGELGTNDPREESSIELLKRSFLETIEKVKPKQVTEPKAEVIFVRKTIMEALSNGVRLTPENLKSETGLPIDDFYAQLKELIDKGNVVESRENGESYLEAENENRQTEN